MKLSVVFGQQRVLAEGSLPQHLFIMNTFSAFLFPTWIHPSTLAAGVVVLGEGSLPRQLFMNLVWLVGTYLFAAVLGVITGDIMERIQVRA